MMHERKISAIIRDTLDPMGVELTWAETDAAAAAIAKEFDGIFEDAAIYDDLRNS